MSNRRRLRLTKAQKAEKLLREKYRCRKCRSSNVEVRDYPDAQLFICRACSFPMRILKEKS